jgi:hypothetical protein
MHLERRLLLAAIAGALTMFVWGGLSHMVLFKGAGFTRMPNEERVVAALRSSLSQDGLYFLPSPDFSGNASASERAAFDARFRAGPTGMLVYHPSGGTPVSPQKLLVQLLSALLAGAIATYVLSRMAAPYWQRVLASGLLGAFACLSVSTIYWNWYGFPTAFYLAQWADMVLGWSLAGAVIARVAPPARQLSSA